MGTGVKLAPPYACLGMGKFENVAFNSDFHLLDKIILWKRFIDDVLMLFRGSEKGCQDLVNWLNSLYPGGRIIENIQFPRVSLGTIPKLILGNFVPMNRSGNIIPKNNLGNLGSILLQA